MIHVKKISLAFKDRILFDNITVSFEKEKIGFVGRNGAGKSTLLKIIAGIQHPDSGTIGIERNTQIAYMPQELTMQSSKSVFDEIMEAFANMLRLLEKKRRLEHLLEQGKDTSGELATQYITVTEQSEQFKQHEAERAAYNTAYGLGFTHQMLTQPVQTLSVGWKMRIVLAKLLLQNADFYLFDEPTNHLDMVSKEWFAEFLQQAPSGFLMATHDRHFLEQVCSHIFELEQGSGTLYTGNFSRYLTQKEERERIAQLTRKSQEQAIAQKQKTIERFRAKSSKAKMAQSMEKQLQRIELIDIAPPLPTMNITLPPVARSGSIVVTIKHVSHSFGSKTVLHNISGEVARNDRVAVIAPNGKGKSTLFNLIAGKIPVQSGTITFGHNVTPGFFEQDQAAVLIPHHTILEEVTSAVALPEKNIRSMLGTFLFTGDDVDKKIHMLSGGERNRVAMCKLLLLNPNFLLLDEPTNHLDLYAKEALLQALMRYQGTILFVSHDHDFISRLATRIFAITDTGLTMFNGDYESYLWMIRQKEATEPNQSSVSKQTHKAAPKDHHKKTAAINKQINHLEKRIHKLEQSRDKLLEQLASHPYGSQKFETINKKLETINNELHELETKWEQLYS